MSEVHVVDAGRLRLAFAHAVDRWSHSIAVEVDGMWQTLLTSVEGDAADPWPPSPAFQDLRLEAIDDTTQEFQLMGQCGTGVYSAAIRCDQARGTIDFDICLRIRAPKKDHASGDPSAIREDMARSTYRCVPPAELQHSPEGVAIHLPGAPGPFTIQPHASAAATISVERINGMDQLLLRGPQPDSGRQTPKSAAQSLRWKYVVALDSNAPSHRDPN